ncbi:hypothetical protein FQR65_LT03963 [Abscondita terminalis]|nr:hypothetical protein FQR65_LT03963 [Abscondita terminalis]
MKTQFFLLTVLVIIFEVRGLDFHYHKHENLTKVLKIFSESYSKLSPELYSIGKSKQQRDLWVVKLTAANSTDVTIPNVKLIANIHGNEAVGRELLLHLIEYLGENYGKDPNVTWIMNNTRIHILPSMNPDGFEKAAEGICIGEHGRCNVKNMDLNRNFPDYYIKNLFPIQPESKAIQKWMNEIPFILSASLHGGALVVNYPFDTIKELTSLPVNPPSLSADDDVFIYLAKVYANRHPEMHLGLPCPAGGKNFTGGITNGAAWYPLRGGMQDFNYFQHGCMELTLEISCCKYPPAKELPRLWEDNKYALIEFIQQAHRGVRGVIFNNEDKKTISGASLKIIGREMYFNSSKNGEFWRILLPGKYELQVNASGFYSEIVPFDVLPDKNSKPVPTILATPMYKLGSPKPTTTTPTTTTIFSKIIPTSTHFVSHPVENNKRPIYTDEIRNQNAREDPLSLGSTSHKSQSSKMIAVSQLIIISYYY